jgi:hypothetical protein
LVSQLDEDEDIDAERTCEEESVWRGYHLSQAWTNLRYLRLYGVLLDGVKDLVALVYENSRLEELVLSYCRLNEPSSSAKLSQELRPISEPKEDDAHTVSACDQEFKEVISRLKGCLLLVG